MFFYSFFADELSTFFYQRWGVQLLAFCVRKGELQRKLIMPWGGCIVAVVVFFNFCSFLTVLGDRSWAHTNTKLSQTFATKNNK